MSSWLRLHWSLGWQSVRSGCIAFLCCLLVILPSGTGSALSVSSSALQELRLHLETAATQLANLQERLTQREQQISSLNGELQEVKESLTKSKSGIKKLQQELNEAKRLAGTSKRELQETQSSLDQLQTKYEQASKSFELYRQELQKQVSQLKSERNVAEKSGKLGKIVAVVEAIVLGLVGIGFATQVFHVGR